MIQLSDRVLIRPRQELCVSFRSSPSVTLDYTPVTRSDAVTLNRPGECSHRYSLDLSQGRGTLVSSQTVHLCTYTGCKHTLNLHGWHLPRLLPASNATQILAKLVSTTNHKWPTTQKQFLQLSHFWWVVVVSHCVANLFIVPWLGVGISPFRRVFESNWPGSGDQLFTTTSNTLCWHLANCLDNIIPMRACFASQPLYPLCSHEKATLYPAKCSLGSDTLSLFSSPSVSWWPSAVPDILSALQKWLIESS